MTADMLLAELDAYFRLLWIFTGIITGSGILLTALFFTNRLARGRHRQTLDYSRHVRSAQEEERAIIARELHDSVIAGLRRLSFLAYDKEPRREDAAPLSDRINAECDALIRRVRELCQTLVPPDFNRLGLRLSLENLCASFTKTAKSGCSLAAPHDLDTFPLTAEGKFHSFRIIQEALTNVEKHAAAAEVSVVLRREDTALIVLVSDNGKGFSPDFGPTFKGRSLAQQDRLAMQDRLTGLGLPGMRDRAAILGGSLDIRSEPGAGTLVRLVVPLAAESHSHESL